MCKLMKKLYMSVAIGLVVYSVGFFAVVPTRILTANSELWFVRDFSRGLYDVLYWSWVGKLDRSNIIREVWNGNTLFWCGEIESCTL